jgi:3',5'-cyclic AMP phosphodiesterase CpdA
VTGDLTNLSLSAEFARARLLIDRIAGGPARVTVIPGNHDAYTQAAVTQRRFERAFAPYLPDPPAWPMTRELGDVVLCALSTAVATPLGFASGRVGEEQRAKLEAALVLAERQRKFRLVALHHPPVRARGTELRQLSDRAAFAQTLHRYGCDLVIHGHDHRAQRHQLPGPRGPIPIYGAPSVTYTDPRPDRAAAYNVYTVKDGLLVSVDAREQARW